MLRLQGIKKIIEQRNIKCSLLITFLLFVLELNKISTWALNLTFMAYADHAFFKLPSFYLLLLFGIFDVKAYSFFTILQPSKTPATGSWQIMRHVESKLLTPEDI